MRFRFRFCLYSFDSPLTDDWPDLKEGFNFRYQPEHYPLHRGTAAAPGVSQGSDGVWQQTAQLPGFKDATLAWWQHCLQLARGLVRLFALALDLPEAYFDAVTTHPGSDGLYICYPGTDDDGDDVIKPETQDVGIGSHTDMQCFTLLWQDESGGLEVLLPAEAATGDEEGVYEWVGATPRPGTLVVNIADFLQQLSNDRFRSTVHRVYNRQAAARFSMPFFFGFNYDAECAVVPTCIDNAHPPRYAPISCGKASPPSLGLPVSLLASSNNRSGATSAWSWRALGPGRPRPQPRLRQRPSQRSGRGSAAACLTVVMLAATVRSSRCGGTRREKGYNPSFEPFQGPAVPRFGAAMCLCPRLFQSVNLVDPILMPRSAPLCCVLLVTRCP